MLCPVTMLGPVMRRDKRDARPTAKKSAYGFYRVHSRLVELMLTLLVNFEGIVCTIIERHA